MHKVVLHERHFVDPDDEDMHTQNVENMWMRAKHKLRRQFGTSRDLFPSYIHEFVFRNLLKNSDVFSEFVVAVTESYPF